MRTLHNLAIYALNMDDRALGDVDELSYLRNGGIVRHYYEIDADYDLWARRPLADTGRSLVDTALIRSCNVTILRDFFGQAWF